MKARSVDAILTRLAASGERATFRDDSGRLACPVCGHKCTAATAATPGECAAPGPGDLTICAACCALLLFTEGGGVRPATAEEHQALDPESRAELDAAIAAIRDMRRQVGMVPT